MDQENLKPISKSFEPRQSTVISLLIASLFTGTFTFLLFYVPTGSVVLALPIALALIVYIYFRSRNDVQEGFWMEVWPEKIRFRDGRGIHEIKIG